MILLSRTLIDVGPCSNRQQHDTILENRIISLNQMKNPKEPGLNEIPLSLSDFLKSFKKNMPTNFPQVREGDLLKFKKEHEPLFKKGNTWSLDQHRKKVMDWLPRNIVAE